MADEDQVLFACGRIGIGNGGHGPRLDIRQKLVIDCDRDYAFGYPEPPDHVLEVEGEGNG